MIIESIGWNRSGEGSGQTRGFQSGIKHSLAFALKYTLTIEELSFRVAFNLEYESGCSWDATQVLI